MPHPIHLPIGIYSERQNVRHDCRIQDQQQNYQNVRPTSETIIANTISPSSTGKQSISYFNNRNQMTFVKNVNNRIRPFPAGSSSTPFSIANPNYYNIPQPTSNYYYETTTTTTKGPPLPARPMLTYPRRLAIESVQSLAAVKSPIPNLAPISDVEFVTQKAKQFEDEENEIEGSSPKSNSKRSRKLIKATSVLILSLILFLSYDSMITSVMDMTMHLSEGGLLTKDWQIPPVPFDACFYLFELVNGKQFLRGAKPRVQEHGPFCYKEFKKRKIVKWNEHTVTFTESFKFEFNDRESKSLDTRLQVLNYPIFFTILLVKHMLESFYLSFSSPLVFNMVSLSLRATGESLIEERSARELLDGRKIKLVEYLNMMLSPLKPLGIPVPEFGAGAYKMHNSSFGFVSQRLFTEFGPYEVYTKSEDGHTFGEIYQFDEKSELPLYKYPCNQLKGGDGMFFGPRLETQNVYVFNQHACRTLPLVKNGHPRGFTVARYTVNPHIFDMSRVENRCFCTGDRSWQECDGWTDMSPCFGGIPMGLSFPHFMNTPRRLREVDGLKPDPALHWGYLDIEPQIGVPAGGRIGIQGVMQIAPISSVSSMASLPKVMLPIFWTHEGANLKGFMIVLMSIGSNSIRYGSYASLLMGLSYSTLSFYKAFQQR